MQQMESFLGRVILVTGIMLAAPAGSAAEDDLAVATFAGGCFWCVEADFDKVEGVVETISGYTGGKEEDPTYKEVSSGATGHTEAVRIKYDPDQVSYEELLEVFWINHDPTTVDRQFCDQGSQYRPGIFYHNAEQKRLAEQSKKHVKMAESFEVLTPVQEATAFYPAEDYHQNYYKKNPIRYKVYRYGCGRDARLRELWDGSYPES